MSQYGADSDTCARTFRYSSIACEILIFGLVGWFVGPYIFGPGGDVLGAFIGAMIGTLMMFITLFYIAGVFGKGKQKQEKT
ncbi:MAG: hypothetical protein ACFFCO_01835 [Promethearchaeota archaeon]